MKRNWHIFLWLFFYQNVVMSMQRMPISQAAATMKLPNANAPKNLFNIDDIVSSFKLDPNAERKIYKEFDQSPKIVSANMDQNFLHRYEIPNIYSWQNDDVQKQNKRLFDQGLPHSFSSLFAKFIPKTVERKFEKIISWLTGLSDVKEAIFQKQLKQFGSWIYTKSLKVGDMLQGYLVQDIVHMELFDLHNLFSLNEKSSDSDIENVQESLIRHILSYYGLEHHISIKDFMKAEFKKTIQNAIKDIDDPLKAKEYVMFCLNHENKLVQLVTLHKLIFVPSAYIGPLFPMLSIVISAEVSHSIIEKITQHSLTIEQAREERKKYPWISIIEKAIILGLWIPMLFINYRLMKVVMSYESGMLDNDSTHWFPVKIDDN